VNSPNWSGYSIVDSKNPFKNGETFAQFTVPVAQQAVGACTGSTDHGSAWTGIDGNGSRDVLQAGVEFDAYCGGGSKSQFYSAWYEWYPAGEVRIGNFAVAPGDVMRVVVWNSSPTIGHALIVNYTTNSEVALGFAAPHGTTLAGNSVEWILERPFIGGAFATLTNYIANPFTDCFAFNTTGRTRYYYPGQSPTGTEYALTMTDNSGKPISTAELQGLWDLWFYDEGSAY
jgi:hypothetical protein